MGYIPLGAVFGFLFVEAGGSGWLALACSVFIYAGAAQFMMIPMLVAGASYGTIALATLVLNLRHVFYGISLLKNMPAGRWQRWYSVFALTDETYSVLTTLPQAQRARHMALVSALNQCWWVLGTGIGVLVGSAAQLSLAGLDFVLACLFAVLAVEQWRAKRVVTPIWVAVAAYAVATWVAPDQALAIAIGLSLVACALLKTPAAPKAQGVNND
jgi:4-azaleucine resistance transporter AzlC